MKIVSSNALKKTMQIIKSALAGKEPSFTKNSGFNLRRTDTVENDSLKVFTAKGALDLNNALNNAKTEKGGYSGTANDLSNRINTAQNTADSGVTKANAAQTAANNANANAEGRLSKNGGTVNGTLDFKNKSAISFNNEFGLCRIKDGNGDLSNLSINNLSIESWWGIGFKRSDSSSHFTHHFDCRSGDFGMGGNFVANGTITGAKTINAIWNDYAEYFPKKENYITEAGDIIALSELDGEEFYELATENHTLIVGAHSDQYGHLIGGETPPEGEDYEEFNKKKYIPVGLVGRLPVKFIGDAKKGTKVVPSHIPGVGRTFDKTKDNYDNVIGYIVENNKEEGVRRVKIKIGK